MPQSFEHRPSRTRTVFGWIIALATASTSAAATSASAQRAPVWSLDESSRHSSADRFIAGLTAALYGEITVEKGRVKQGNFNDYPMLRMRETPVIAVHIVKNHEEPGGVGEPAVPPIAPAVTNAIFALTGRRVRRLPIRLDSARAGG